MFAYEMLNAMVFFYKGITAENHIKSASLCNWINTIREYDQISQNNGHSRVDGRHPVRPRYGEIYVVDFGTNVGAEFVDIHLGLIIQNDVGNTYSDTTIVLPITELKSYEKFDKNLHYKLTNKHFVSVEKRGLDKDPSKIKIADIIAIDKSRLGQPVGKLSPETMCDINILLKRVLCLG